MIKGPMKLSHFLFQADIMAKSIGFTCHEDETKSTKFRKIKQWIFIVLSVNLITVFLEELLFILDAITHRENFIEAVRNVTYSTTTFTSLVTVFSVMRKKRFLTTLMGDVRKLFPTDSKLQQHFHVRRFMIHFNVISFVLVVLHEILIWWHNLNTVANYLICKYWECSKIVPRRLPYNAWLPWPWQDHWSYYILYISHVLAAQTCISGQVANNLILCSVATQLIMHYCYLARQIENYQPTLIFVEDEKFLKDVINYHEKIISLTWYLNEVFGVSILVNFFATSFNICFLGFLMTTNVQTDILILLITFICCALLQMFLICYYGQELISKSENIALAIYNHNWLLSDVHYRKMLVVIIQRAQRPTYLKATPLLHLSMGTMTVLMQLSYKFFALLRTMYSN